MWSKAGSGKGTTLCGEKESLGLDTHTERTPEVLAFEIRSPGLNSSNSHSIGTIASLLPRICCSGQGDFNYPVDLHTPRAHSEPFGTVRPTIAETCLMLGFRLAVGTGTYPHVCWGWLVGLSEQVGGLGNHVFKFYINLRSEIGNIHQVILPPPPSSNT